MRAISLLLLLFFATQAACASESIYGSEFDYTKAKPASANFPGKTDGEIEAYCSKDSLGNMELSACTQFKFERTRDMLNKKLLEIEASISSGDKEHRVNGEPEALPFFKKSQANWQLYRDNECYSNVYEVGQASLRFVDFWACMTRITKSRFDELTKPNADE
jgi:uncharacterized protein YecT (DUF1311 family)